MSGLTSGASDGAAIIREGRRAVTQGLIYAAILSAFINMLQLTVPLFMLQVHDRVINSRSFDTLLLLSIIAVGALVLYAILEFVRSLTFIVIGSKLARRLSLPTLEAAVTASLEQGSSRATQALRDLTDLRTFVTGNAISAPMEAMWAPIFLTVLFALHPLYGLVALLSGLIIVALSIIADLVARAVLKEANEAQIDATAKVGASLRHAEVIEAMGMLQPLARHWQRSQRRAAELLDSGNRRTRLIASVTRSARMMMQVAMLALGAVLVIDGSVTAGSMIASTIITGRLLQPFDNMVENWRQWRFALAAWGRIRELVESQPTIRERTPTPRPAGGLVVEKLSHAVPGSQVPLLKGLNFELEPGEVLGVVGPSAAGKSTLARMMVGLVRPSSGGIYLGGHNVYSWERDSFGRSVGYLPQSISLIDGTVRDNIARMRDDDPLGVLEAARLAGVHEMIGRLPLGYDTPVGDSQLTLSGGQKQRIALARALYGRPKLIVLDEPNANLDALGEQALIEALTVAKAEGAIVVLIAHRPSIMQIADKMLVLQENRSWQFGPRSAVAATIMPGGGATVEPRPKVAALPKGGAA